MGTHVTTPMPNDHIFRILVVDDTQDIRDLLEVADILVCEAHTGMMVEVRVPQ